MLFVDFQRLFLSFSAKSCIHHFMWVFVCIFHLKHHVLEQKKIGSFFNYWQAPINKHFKFFFFFCQKERTFTIQSIIAQGYASLSVCLSVILPALSYPGKKQTTPFFQRLLSFLFPLMSFFHFDCVCSVKHFY